jgi:hypothetical protein
MLADAEQVSDGELFDRPVSRTRMNVSMKACGPFEVPVPGRIPFSYGLSKLSDT